MKIIAVATEEEYELAKKQFKRHKIIKTGVGGINVIETLKHYPRWLKIINFGYCGSNNIPIGTKVSINKCKLYHPNVEYEEITYKLDGTINCYTSNDFVLNTDIKEPCVFDMELAYICALGFKNITAIKIVSDNLSLREYENNINKKRVV